MRGFARLDRRLDRREHPWRKNPPHPPMVLKKMPADAFDAHNSPAPRSAAAAKTAAATAEPAALARAAATAAPIAAARTAVAVAATAAARRHEVNEHGDKERE